MSNPLQGWNIISRRDLHEMTRQSFRNEREEREKIKKAWCEFHERTNKVTDTKRKFTILKEVAAKYHFNEDWFMTQVNI